MPWNKVEAADRARELRLRKKLEGACMYSGCDDPVEEYKSCCRKHLDQIRLWNRRHFLKRMSNGLCRRCGEPQSDSSDVYCAKHLAEQREYARKTRKLLTRKARAL